MRNSSLSFLAGLMLMIGHFPVLAQKREEKPFNERPVIRVSQLNISRQGLLRSDSLSIVATITNASDAPSGQFEFLLVAGDQLIGKQLLKINPNSSITVYFKWVIPREGEYYIKAIADPDEALDESDRSDNIREIKVSSVAGLMEIKDKPEKDSLLPASIDLLIENISVQGHRFQQNKIRMVTVNFRVTNHSSTNETTAFRTEINITAEGRLKKTYSVNTSSIGAGQSTFISYNIQDAPARFDISIKTDADNVIVESNEQNNTATSFYRNPAPPVDRWISVGPDIITGVNNIGYPWASAIGRLSVMAIHPVSTQTLYVGGQSCGIWKTTDGGSSWFPLTDQISVSVAAIALSPQNASQVFWVTAKQGVYRSDDAGASWIQINMQDLEGLVHGGKLLIHPRDPNIMLVKSEVGIYRSQNGGVNWTLVIPGGTGSGLEIDRASDIMYAAISSQTNNMVAGIYRSNDRGVTWRKLAGCPGGSLPGTNAAIKITIAVFGSKMYAGFKSATEFQLYRTTGIACSVGGIQESSWEKAWKTTTNHRELWSELWANPLDENSLYLGGTAFWRSTDKGSNFSKVSDYDTPSGSAHADHHGFGVLPGQANTIFSLNDGGIYRSVQNGNKGTWNFLGKGIANVEFYDFADAFTKDELLLGGTQDNGTIKTEGSLDWKAIRGGDGATVDIDNTDAGIMYSMSQYASSIQRSVNGGGNWSNMFSGLPDGAVCFNTRYHLHPKKMNILLAACNSLWRITDPAGSWQNIFTPPDGIVTGSAVEPSGDIYLAGTSRGKLFVGVNGNNFQQVFSHPSLSSVADIECDPNNSAVIFLGCAGSSNGRVYMLRKGQTGTYNASDITGNLLVGINVQCISVDRMNPLTIYVGSSKGVYRGRSLNQGQTWQWSPYMDGLPLADIRDLECHPVSGVLSAATYGRSIFEVSTDDPLGSVLAMEGKINFLRVHDVDTKFGPPNDVLDAEAIIQLDTKPGHYFGLQLRPDTKEVTNSSSLKLIRTAFEAGLPVRIEYIRNGIHSGRIIRTNLK